MTASLKTSLVAGVVFGVGVVVVAVNRLKGIILPFLFLFLFLFFVIDLKKWINDTIFDGEKRRLFSGMGSLKCAFRVWGRMFVFFISVVSTILVARFFGYDCINVK